MAPVCIPKLDDSLHAHKSTHENGMWIVSKLLLSDKLAQWRHHMIDKRGVY